MFQDIVCRWQGSAHDSTIFNNSCLRLDFENGIYGANTLLVGDSGYPLRSYLMTPLLQPGTAAEFLYNESQIRTRNPIERTFGVWKRSSLGIKLSHEKVEAVVAAAAVLHNIAILEQDQLPAMNEEIEAGILLGNINENYGERRIL